MMSDRRLSISELAKKSNIHYTMISNYLSEDKRGRLPGLETITKLSHALNCTPNDLLGIDEKTLTPEDKKFEAYNSLPDDQKDLIDRMIDTLSAKPKSESHDTKNNEE